MLPRMSYNQQPGYPQQQGHGHPQQQWGPPAPIPKSGRGGTILAIVLGVLLVVAIAGGLAFYFYAAQRPAPTAADVCARLERASVANRCRPSTPGGLGSAAIERIEFDIPDLKGGGQVLRFEKSEYYEGAVSAFAAASVLVGRHQYGNPRTLIFVQLNSEATQWTGDNARAVVNDP